MRSAPWTALFLFLLALSSSPAEAREFPAARVLQQRTAYWALGTAPVELHVAPGCATTVRLEAFPELRSLEPTEGRSIPQLHPIDAASFSISPPGDFAVGERALVTVKLGPPELALSLLLVSRKDVVDGELRLVRLRAPTPEELDVDAVARLLSATPQEGLSLAEEEGLMMQGSKVRVEVESILRLGSRMFLTFALHSVRRSSGPWKLEQARLRVLLEEGAQVEVPLLLVLTPTNQVQRRYTLVAPLPERPLRLFLAVEGEGAPEGFFALSSSEKRSSP
ncbi:MAG TPA: hypothetical protein VEY88_07540 [Archangium sp.]|nr:hypothetical protein [Archangium sp.]